MPNAITCYSIEDAIKAKTNSNSVFIIANERKRQNGKIGRYFTIFESFKEFLRIRHKYPHCHEILIDHENNKPDPAGRLVFDFDIKPTPELKIPQSFKKQIENTIDEVIEKYFNNIDINKFIYVWSTSQNPNKFSKHLTVKNLYFDDWISMSKIFYRLFCIIWDEKYFWIKSNKLIDFQIVRKHASLRMVGSSKLDGYPLNMDNETHTLIDSLIRIYSKKHKDIEQIVTKDNINQSVFVNVLYEPQTETSDQHITISFNPKKIEKPVYSQIIYDKAYEIYNKIDPNVFKMGKINGKTLSLMRTRASKCLLSGRIHEHENAFILIEKGDTSYSIRFGCNRFCYYKKILFLASITIDNMIVMYDPNFEPAKKKKRKTKIIDI